MFLIRAAGRSRPEILAELERRLRLEPEEEVGVAGGELRDIALLRIPQLFAHLDAVALDQPAGLRRRGRGAVSPEGRRPASRVTTHVLDAVTGRPAAGVAVVLERRGGRRLGAGRGGPDGRRTDGSAGSGRTSSTRGRTG